MTIACSSSTTQNPHARTDLRRPGRGTSLCLSTVSYAIRCFLFVLRRGSTTGVNIHWQSSRSLHSPAGEHGAFSAIQKRFSHLRGRRAHCRARAIVRPEDRALGRRSPWLVGRAYGLGDSLPRWTSPRRSTRKKVLARDVGGREGGAHLLLCGCFHRAPSYDCSEAGGGEGKAFIGADVQERPVPGRTAFAGPTTAAGYLPHPLSPSVEAATLAQGRRRSPRALRAAPSPRKKARPRCPSE